MRCTRKVIDSWVLGLPDRLATLSLLFLLTPPTIANCIGKARSVIHTFAYNAFVDALHKFAAQSKGKRQLISPDQSSHHSAQFPRGTFSVSRRSRMFN
jgi:hypothetical protein